MSPQPNESDHRVIGVACVGLGEWAEAEKVEPKLRDMYGGGVILRLRHEAGDTVLSVDLDGGAVERLVEALTDQFAASRQDYEEARP
jgi:hypothetical protein